MNTSDFAISYETTAEYARAKDLSAQLHLPINNNAARSLFVSADKLMLKIAPFSPLYADFNIKTWQTRRNAGKQQGLVRAIKPRFGMKIIDATAGWGRDAAILASFGAQVLLLERNPVMAVLLADALARQDDHSKEILKITLLNVDALDYLNVIPEDSYPEIIYLDPMHPTRQKNALVKREMQVLQQFIGADPDIAALLTIAKEKTTHAVVMKWPQCLAAVAQPSRSVSGKTVRFDVFLK